MSAKFILSYLNDIQKVNPDNLLKIFWSMV